MKKILLFMTVATMSLTVNAKILRVNNNTGSSAPYSSIGMALNAAQEGDTIMVDASATSYGDVKIEKTVVLIGSGYWLVENNIIQEGATSVSIKSLEVNAAGCVICGISLETASFNVYGERTIIMRCKTGLITLKKEANNCIIHNNFILGPVQGDNTKVNYLSICNNIFVPGSQGNALYNINNSYVAYNTFAANNPESIYYTNNTTFEKNIWCKYSEISSSGNMFEDNAEIINIQGITRTSRDSDVYSNNAFSTVLNTHGAFAGDSPYILSGVPAGPVVQDLIVPTTVEKGSKLPVTVKVGIQK